MLVTIVAVPNAANTGLDLDRLEKVEDLPAEVALKMLDLGTAREPSDEELDAYRKAQDAPKYDNGGHLPSGSIAHSAPKTATVTTDLRPDATTTDAPAA